MRVELSYATLRQALKGKRGNYRFTQGVFAFDRGWRPLLDDVRDVDLKWRRKSKDRASNDRGDHLVGVQTLTVAPGTYHFAVEVADLIGDGISVFRSTASLGGGEDLAVSDLLLASKITPRGDVVTSREDLIISPNPIRYYTPKTPIHVYFEIYNLVKDDFGRTRYRLAYELAKPKGRLDPARFAVLDDSQRLRFEKDLSQTLSTTGDQTRRVEAEYEGETPDDFTYLEIDVSQIPRGIYALNIEVEDLTSGQTSRKGTVLRVDR